MRNIYFILIILLHTACSSVNDEQLRYVMKLAGNNKAELEKVLQHYQNDSLKLEAAKFLIRNMFHYSYQQGGIMDSVKEARTHANSFGQLEKKYVYKWGGYSYRDLPKIYDAQIITSDYLIDNIEQAFENWEKRSWNKHLSFDEFCEYLLPYRFGNEPLEEWRDLYKNKYAFLLDSVYQGSDVIEAANLVSQYLLEPAFTYCEDFDLPHVGARYLFKYRYGSCVDAADIFAYTCRAIGIPCAEDTEVRGGHMWTAVRDTTGMDVPFWYLNIIAERGYKDINGHDKGKVYRSVYGVQTEKLSYSPKERKGMAPFFQNLIYKDVSKYYFPDTLKLATKELEIANNDLIYLGFFHSNRWWGCAMTKTIDNYAQFDNLESEQVYAPLIYKDDMFKQCGHPFLFDNKKVHAFIPDKNNLRRVKLYRKYPLYDWLHHRLHYIVGTKFEGSNSVDFREVSTIYCVTDTPTVAYNTVYFDKPIKKRYIKYRAPEHNVAEISEVSFYYQGKQVKPLSFRGSQSQTGHRYAVIENISDNDPLTYYISEEKGGFVIFDLGTDNPIDQIVYMPRNDDNFVRQGDFYELFYNNGKHGWESLGKQMADTTYLEYDIPDNALYLLRDYTRGQEEQIFYMEDGKQIFPTY